MQRRRHRKGLLLTLGLSVGMYSLGEVQAGDKDVIGITDLLARHPTLKGAGVIVAQVEASTSGSSEVYQCDPAEAGQLATKFRYYDSAPAYPGFSGFVASQESNHADLVANSFFDVGTGAAPEVAGIRVFHANNFYNDVVNLNLNPTGGYEASIINQSFTFGEENAAVDQRYDHYADQYGLLFVNSVSNDNGPSRSPSSSFNCIAVGEMNLTHGNAVASDGRVKPDLVAPGNRTSYATPYVSGSAAIMKQAAALNHGGAGTATDAADPRTIKALLLNGAVKDAGWVQLAGEPLDRESGAGVLNVNNAHLQLEGGKHVAMNSVNGVAGSAQVPVSSEPSNVSSSLGWNFASISNNRVMGQWRDRFENYYFDLPASGGSHYDATATITWHKNNGQNGINNMDLYLYNVTTGTLVASSASALDNVEHIYEKQLPAGRYALQIVKRADNRVSTSDDVALAFNFQPSTAPTTPIGLSATTTSDTTISLTWIDQATDETAYRVERSLTSMAGFTTVANLAANSTSYNDTGLTPSTQYFYRVVATNVVGDATSSEANAITWSTLQNWRNTHFGSTGNTGNGADGADPDGDNLKNLVEYAIGTDPNDAKGAQGVTAAPLVEIVDVGGSNHLQLTVTRVEKKTDVTYAIQMGSDIAGWAHATTVVTDTPTELKVRSTSPITSENKLFGRLRVTLAP